jgi:hypothetical protein
MASNTPLFRGELVNGGLAVERIMSESWGHFFGKSRFLAVAFLLAAGLSVCEEPLSKNESHCEN